MVHSDPSGKEGEGIRIFSWTAQGAPVTEDAPPPPRTIWACWKLGDSDDDEERWRSRALDVAVDADELRARAPMLQEGPRAFPWVTGAWCFLLSVKDESITAGSHTATCCKRVEPLCCRRNSRVCKKRSVRRMKRALLRGCPAKTLLRKENWGKTREGRLAHCYLPSQPPRRRREDPVRVSQAHNTSPLRIDSVHTHSVLH